MSGADILTFEDYKIKGLVLMYFAFEFKPSDCQEHLEEFLATIDARD